MHDIRIGDLGTGTSMRKVIALCILLVISTPLSGLAEPIEGSGDSERLIVTPDSDVEGESTKTVTTEPEVDPEFAEAFALDRAEQGPEKPVVGPGGPAGVLYRPGTNAMNPDISFTLTTGAGGYFGGNILPQGGHNINNNGFTLQGLEFAASGGVDPYFRYDMKFELAHVHLEEAVLTALALPWNMQMRGGYFFAKFGRANPQCLHLWSFVNAPLTHSRFISEEHFGGTGMEWSVLLPLPWYSMVIAQSYSSDASSGFRSETFGTADVNLSGKTDSFDDLVYVTRFENFFEVTKDWSLLIGNSAAFGQSPYSGDNRASLFGSDLTLKWNGGEQAFEWTTEGVLRQVQIPLDAAQDFGAYTYANFQLTRQWVIGIRGDYADMMTGPDSAKELFGGRETRGSFAVTFFPTHFTKVRVQGDVLSSEFSDDLAYGGFLQVEVIAGAHAPHTF